MLQKAKFLHTLLERVNSKGFDQCMKNVQLLSIADGKCKAQFTVAEEHLNPSGTIHGGFTSTIIDVVSSYALTTYKPDQSPGSSVDLHVTFLKTARLGEVLTVNAETIRAGKTLAFLAVEITKNDGKDVVARGQHTKFIPSIKK
ncbi:acyl-coenzyme A thioesterase 13-like [Cataglyphis hispanica]|uniref:acyl-coenzyme A thioesterase 13-like n=1 Tax=Cataglyphis hispanica TaxID=1086592 RepID=UPI00217F3FF8|nr:acyl-coenzyme A thioesterase 13-like [Cataglyphis hispanica]XP_050458563.1 acyl-coenzyme A thioesterase 13-like [Cataglyphis hispanica]